MSSNSPHREIKPQPLTSSFKDESYSHHRHESQVIQDKQREIDGLKNQNALLTERLKQAEIAIAKLT
jgi:hypothetical protein